jgi:hypothetical protein
MGELQGEANGASQVQQHTENENGFVDTALSVWAVKLLVDSQRKENRVTPWRGI